MKLFAGMTAALACSLALAQAPADNAPPKRLRGTVQSFEAGTLTLKERGGQTVQIAMPDSAGVSEVYPIQLSDIKPNSFIGAASMPTLDGGLRALEVVVFPEAARGTGEGHYEWDLQPGSNMTNATVSSVVSAVQGRTMKVSYKGGEKTITVPEGVPVVTFRAGDKSLLVPGAKVLVMARTADGKTTAQRVLAGKNGFQPPM